MEFNTVVTKNLGRTERRIISVAMLLPEVSSKYISGQLNPRDPRRERLKIKDALRRLRHRRILENPSYGMYRVTPEAREKLSAFAGIFPAVPREALPTNYSLMFTGMKEEVH